MFLQSLQSNVKSRAIGKALSVGTYLLCFVLLHPLDAATYYVASTMSTPAGSDSNAGTSAGVPFATLNKALTTISSGDTVVMKADGNWMNCDATAKPLSSITIQSSALGSLPATGYRVFPSDAANLAKCQYTSGIILGSEWHGSFTLLAGDSNCTPTWASDIFTLPASGGCGDVGIANLANGVQVEIEIAIQGNLNTTSSTLPSGLQSLGGPGTKFYVSACSSSPACGMPGSSFKVAATPGGTAITGSTCTGTCIPSTFQIVIPLQVTAGSSTITVLDSALSTWIVGTPLYFAACGFMSCTTSANPENLALPSPLAADTHYYIKTITGGNQITVAATLGGTAITLTDVGAGPLYASSADVPHDWQFNGLEHTEVSGNTVNGFIQVGVVSASALGTPYNFQVNHDYFHALAGDSTPPVRAIVNNAAGLNVRDSYISGMMNGEAQGIFTGCSPGPTYYYSNFIEGAGENLLAGGATCAWANANQTIAGNYFYKPPMWKITTGTFVPVGACWYDNTDPNFVGGEYYQNTMTSTWYQCNSSSVWATGSAPANLGNPTIKTMTEHKNGRYFTYTGNVYNYVWSAGSNNGAQSGQVWNNGQLAGSGPGMANDHIVMQNNAAYNVYTPSNRSSQCGSATLIQCVPAYVASYHNMVNNLFVISPFACSVFGSGVQTACSVASYLTTWGNPPTPFVGDVMDHNTVFSVETPSYTFSPSTGYGTIDGSCAVYNGNQGALWKNSILIGDFLGDCFSNGDEIANMWSVSALSSLALKAASGTYHATEGSNTITGLVKPANNAAIKWVSADGTITGDYRLDPTSPYSASCSSGCQLSTDGTDLGADTEAIAAATSGAIAGTPTWAVRENFSISVGSTTATATYDRPGATACSMTLYNAPARITGNENADTNTSGKKLDTRTGNTVVGDHVTFVLGFNSALTPSTQYWYKLSCVAADMSTWLLAGDSFTTQATSSVGGSKRSGPSRSAGPRSRQ